ncbi:hypothetical protein C8R44DRAFT_750377 [Mycena epipterygia]|nr:hypothetical protein C8R44DRAFT_750377 [Mycena epipterygia]
MAKRKRKPAVKEGEQKEITSEQAERNRASYRRYYERHPELREKKRVQMAERWAAEKAARRRWDPPKKKKKDRAALEEDKPDSTDPTGVLNAINLRALSSTPDALLAANTTSGGDGARGSLSQTSAEYLAMLTLAEMAEGHAAPEADNDSTPALAMQLSSIRPAPQLMQEQWWRLGITGSIGAFTYVQTLQLMVAELNSGPMSGPTPAEANRWRDEHDPPEPPLLQTMGLERWDELYYWSEQAMLLDPANEWDLPAQLAFATAKKKVGLACAALIAPHSIQCNDEEKDDKLTKKAYPELEPLATVGTTVAGMASSGKNIPAGVQPRLSTNADDIPGLVVAGARRKERVKSVRGNDHTLDELDLS